MRREPAANASARDGERGRAPFASPQLPPPCGFATEVPRRLSVALERGHGASVAALGAIWTSSCATRMDELKREWDEARRRHPRFVLGVAGVAAARRDHRRSVGGVWFLAGLRDGLPDQEAMRRIGEMDQATAVFDDTDRLAFTIFKEQRIEVPLSEVSPNLTKAITSIEDQRFFEHHGFDLVRIASAALANVRHNRRAQGGSTITQQLARQSFLTPNKSYRRKMQELILAARLERLYTKPQILELYFNKVYFGDGLYGVEAASRGYFGKHASRGDGRGGGAAGRAREIAVELCADGQPASARSRAATPSCRRCSTTARSIARRISPRAAAKPALHDTLREEEPHGQYFKEQVRQELVNRFGWQRVYQGGLRVFSTIDMPMQIAAEAAIADQIDAIEGRRAAWQARRAAARQKAGKAARATIRPTRCRRRWSRSNRTPARCARWSAAATSTPAISTAPFRRTASPARRSSRSSTRRRSRLASRRRPCSIISTIRSPRRRARGRRKTSTRPSPTMSLRTGLAHVEQSRRGAPAAGGRHPAHGAVREDDGRRRRAERAVARARLRRSDAAADDRGLRGVRQPRPGAGADVDSPRRGSRRPACCTSRRRRRSARSATRPRS